jgi:hypothetical protein
MSEQSKEEEAKIQRDIQETRDSLALTIQALEAKLNPPDLKEKIEAGLTQVEARAKVLLNEQIDATKVFLGQKIGEAKVHLREEMTVLEGRAKQGLSEAGTALKHGLLEVKESIKTDLREAYTEAKQSFRAATVGRALNLATTIGETMTGAGIVWMVISRTRARRIRSEDIIAETADGDAAQDGSLGAADRPVSKVSEAISHTSDVVNSALHKATSAVGAAVQGLTDAAGSAATQAGTKAKAIAQSAGETASRIAGQAGQAYQRASEGTRAGIERINQGYANTLQENPLFIAGAALAIGAILGFAFPRSGREDRLLGPSRDRLLRRAGQSAQELASSLAGRAEEAIENATRSAKDAARA